MSLPPEFDGRLGSGFRWGTGCWGIAEHNGNIEKRVVRDRHI